MEIKYLYLNQQRKMTMKFKKTIKRLRVIKKDDKGPLDLTRQVDEFDRGPLDLTRQVDELKKENIRLKKKLRESVAHNKMMYNFP